MRRFFIISFALSLLSPLTLVVTQAATATTTGYGFAPTESPGHNKPDFPLVKIPLRQACDILRQFFNATGGPEWTNRDGWEKGTPVHDDPNISQRRSEMPQTGEGDRLFIRSEPDIARLPLPTGTGDSASTNLHPSNCCQWYGVVCIGPDGNIPAPWPPYDDDYIPARAPPPERRRRDLVQSISQDTEADTKRHSGYYSSGNHDKSHHHRPRTSHNHSPARHASSTVTPGHPGNQPISMTVIHPLRSEVEDGLGDDWQIIGLGLAFNHLVGPIPECLGSLPNLMVLNLSNNELTGPVPPSIGNLTHLRRLDLSSNLIQGTFPEPVTRIFMLQELVLKNNYMTGVLPDSVLTMKQLTQLSIANNEFDGALPVGLFSALNKLRVLNIDQNGFVGEIGADVGEMEGLIKFSARANELRGTLPDSFGRCKNLQKLDLGDNHIAGELPDGLFNLTNLRILDLSTNRLRGNLLPRIGQLTRLTKLVLSHNTLTGPLPVELQDLVHLEYLVVNYNHFDGTFPISRAPPLLGVCLVQPNSFSECPPVSSVDDSKTLAYQCNLDCSDRVIHPEVYDAISQASQKPASWRIALLVTLVSVTVMLATL